MRFMDFGMIKHKSQSLFTFLHIFKPSENFTVGLFHHSVNTYINQVIGEIIRVERVKVTFTKVLTISM
jgi:hypothetical protein